MNLKPNYRTVTVTPACMVIRDIGPWDKHLTVTNGAQQVAKELQSKLNGRRLFYIDSEGELGELLIKEGKFAGYAQIR